MRERSAAAIARRHTQNHILRQILIHSAQPVAHPRAEGWMLQLAWVPAGLPCELCAVIVVNCPKRPDHGEVVRAFTDMPEPVADHETGLSVGLVACLQGHDQLAVPMRRIPANDVL